MSSASQSDVYPNFDLKQELERLQENSEAHYPDLAEFLRNLLRKIHLDVPLKEIGYELTLHLTPAFFREHLSLFYDFQKIFHHCPELLGQESLTQVLCSSSFRIEHPEAQKSGYVPTFLLMVQSPVLEPQLTKDLEQKRKSRVYFEGIASGTFGLVVNYLQTNQMTELESWDVFDIFKFASSYRIKDLQNRCLKGLMLYFKKNQDLEHFCDFWIYGQHYQMAEYNWVCFEIAKELNAEHYHEFSNCLKAKMNAIEHSEYGMFDYVRELEAFTASFRESRGLKFQAKSGRIEAVISSRHVSTVQILKRASQFFKMETFSATKEPT